MINYRMTQIRDYEKSDAPDLWNIFYDTIRNINIRDYTQAQVKAWAPNGLDPQIWQSKMDSISPFIAEIDGEVVGYAGLQDSGLIDHFYCHHNYQRQGVGRCLMDHVLSVGKSKGIARFYSEVSITARPFYEKLGFTVTKAQIVEIRGEKLQNFVMEKFS